MNDVGYLAVYGTLRVGHGNYQWFLSHATCVREKDTVRGYVMRTFGGYPAIFYTGNPDDTIEVDVFSRETIGNEAFAGLDGMELGAGYDQAIVTTEGGYEALIYTMEADASGGYFDIPIPSGNWNEYVEAA